METNQYIDKQALAELYGDSLDFAAKAFGIFLRDFPSKKEAIQQCIDTRDTKELKRILHILKSNFGYLGATGTMKAIEAAEYEYAETGNDEVFLSPTLLSHINEAHDAIQLYYQEHLLKK